MKIFITGSESFIGSFLWDALTKLGHDVSGVDLAPPTKKGSTKFDLRDPNLPDFIPERATVIHLAAVSTDPLCKADPLNGFDINVAGTINVAKAATKRNASQFIFASTEWVYGNVRNDEEQNEDYPILIEKIQGPYAISKLIGENILRTSNLPNTTILRFGIVYAARLVNWSAVESLADKVYRSEPITIGSAATSRRFIYVTDLCAGIIASIGRQGFEVFNLTGERNITLSEIIETTGTIVGKSVSYTESAPENPSVRNPPNTKATSTLNWVPKVSITEGITNVLNYWKSNSQ
jgi:UDP-glucose 4-epimerase